MDKTKEGLKTSNSYTHEFALNLSDTALKDLRKTIEEYNQSVKNVLIAANNLRSVYAKVSSIMPKETLIDPAVIEAIIKKNENIRLKSP